MRKFKVNSYYLKLVSFALGIVAVAILSFSATYAYLTSKDVVNNNFGVGENTVEIEEEFEPPHKVTPGATIKKRPSIKNTGNEDVYVRVRILFSDDKVKEIIDDLEINSSFVLNDGWYYYNKVLKTNSSTPDIFQDIKVKSNISQEAIFDFDVIIYAESVNSSKYSSYQDAFGL